MSTRIQDLPSATTILDTDRFVLEQGGTAKCLLGEKLKAYIEGLGSIASITQNADYTLTITFTDSSTFTTAACRGIQGAQGSDGVSPTVTLTPAAGGTTLTITDATGVHTAFITNGTGAGDMLSSVYDASGDVAAVGIVSYVATQLLTKLSLSGGNITGSLTVGGNRVLTVADVYDGTVS